MGHGLLNLVNGWIFEKVVSHLYARFIVQTDKMVQSKKKHG